MGMVVSCVYLCCSLVVTMLGNYGIENASLDSITDNAALVASRDLRVSMPGKFISFNAGTQTASVQPQISAVLDDGSPLTMPVLVDVPVQFPRGGGFCVTFPIKAGDECLIVIADRCIDGWFATGGISPPLEYRMHDLSDGFAIPGVSSVPNVIPSFGMDGIVIRKLDNSAYFKIDEGGNIEADGTQMTVKCPVIFEQLFTYMGGMAGSGGSGTTIEGIIALLGQLLVNNKVMDDRHTHDGVVPGGGKTGGVS
jgi:hypothetical protein